MPDDTLTAAIKEAYSLAPTNIVTLETIELYHPDVTDRVYLVRDRQNQTLTLENGTAQVFEAAPFKLTRPSSGQSGSQELILTIDNIDRRISEFVNAAKESTTPIEVKFRPYLSNDLTTPQIDPPLNLFLRSVTINEYHVQGRATFADILNSRFLTETYTRSKFPSLANL